MDARMAELRLLTDLAEHTVRRFRCWPGLECETYGLEMQAFRDLLLGLLLDGCLNGTANIAFGAKSGYLDREASVLQAFNELVEGQEASLRLNHRGRLRLARLRDELRANRLRDKFGILIDQRHLERDLMVATLTAKETAPLTIVLADLDHFKVINDTLSYTEGDAALRRYFSTADRILGTKGDVYCRGGDEILAVLPEVNDTEAAALAEALRLAIEDEFSANPNTRLNAQPTASIGAVTTVHRLSPKHLEQCVADALHEAKQAGRNRVVHRRAVSE
ncbi:MAG: diguanylate cyclase [Myxococcales bacterium]|nr:diguanylate cyclase [Myxococcales bacterium]